MQQTYQPNVRAVTHSCRSNTLNPADVQRMQLALHREAPLTHAASAPKVAALFAAMSPVSITIGAM